MARGVDIAVVGAGIAGCIVAARASEDPRRSVLLLEAGPDDVASASQRSPWFFDALADPGRTWPGRFVQGVAGGAPRAYTLGRGIGGSGAINAMLAHTGPPDDYARWEALGCPGWGWSDVAPVFARLPLPVRTLAPGARGPVAAAVAAAGGQAAPLGIHPDGSRATPAEVHLAAARARPNLEVRAGATVQHLLVDGQVVVGVELDGGEQVTAGAVVVCAGALGTASLLRASGVGRATIGSRLKDHPAVAFTLALRDGLAREGARHVIATEARLTVDGVPQGVQILPLDGTVPGGATVQAHGAVMASLMQVQATGSMAGTTTDLGLLGHPLDRARMRGAVRHLVALCASPPLHAIAASVACDDAGTPAVALRELDDDELDGWIAAHVTSYSHAACTCPMGEAGDPSAIVDVTGAVHGWDGIRLCDASVFPDLPRAGPARPVAMVAERIARWVIRDAGRTRGPGCL